MNKGKVEAFDLVINVLKEYEKNLDNLLNKLESLLETLSTLIRRLEYLFERIEQTT